MTAVSIPGQGGLVHPFFAERASIAPGFSALTVDATGEIVAVVGRVYWADRGSHDIRTIGWRSGAGVVSAGGSGITVSLQDVDTATGIPPRPDGVQDQSVGVALNTVASSTWQEHTLSADRVGVAHGAQLACCWEFDVSGRQGVDVLTVAALAATNPASPMGSVALMFAAAAWGAQNVVPVMLLKAADGAVGVLATSWPVSAINAHAINTGTTPDEIAGQLKFPAAVTLEGVSLPMTFANGADFSVILYTGTTATETLTMDEDQTVTGTTAPGWKYFHFATPRALDADTVYRVAVRPDTANSVTVYSLDVNAAEYLDLFAGQDFHYWDRVNAGAWANETLTRWLMMRAHISKIDSGGSGGGGGLTVLRRPHSNRLIA